MSSKCYQIVLKQVDPNILYILFAILKGKRQRIEAYRWNTSPSPSRYQGIASFIAWAHFVHLSSLSFFSSLRQDPFNFPVRKRISQIYNTFRIWVYILAKKLLLKDPSVQPNHNCWPILFSQKPTSMSSIFNTYVNSKQYSILLC